MTNDTKYMFLSFLDSATNINLGACIVECPNDVVAAALKAKLLGINPGGEVLGFPLTAEQFEIESMDKNKLYSPQELKKLNYKKIYERG